MDMTQKRLEGGIIIIMKYLKKPLLFLLAAALIFIVSCGGINNTNSSESNPAESGASGDFSAISDNGSESVESSTSEESQPEPNPFLRRGVNFGDLIYTPPDLDAINREIEYIEELLDNNGTAFALTFAFRNLNRLMEEADTQYTLLLIFQSLDTSDEVIAEEISLLTWEMAEVEREYYRVAEKLLSSSHGGEIFADYTNEEKQEILLKNLISDSDYAEIRKTITECENSYISHLSQTVTIDGSQKTLKEVWDEKGYTEYLKQLNKFSGEIYITLMSLYKRLAEKAGYESYADYAYAHVYSRDYTKEDSKALQGYVKEYIAPLYRILAGRVSFSSYGKAEDVLAYDDIFKEYFLSVSHDMYDAYDFMKKYGLCSLDKGENKQAGAYTTYLPAFDIPFVFAGGSGEYTDIQTFAHEFGHFYAYYLHGGDLPYMIDIDEIHSQANEFMFLDNYRDIFGKEAGEKIKNYELVSKIGTLVVSCALDEFEQKAFEGGYTDAEELNTLYSGIMKEYGLGGTISGAGYYWTKIHHLFLYPFYYISYAASLIPSFQIYENFVAQKELGVELYNSVMAKSVTTSGFLDLLKQTGLKSPFEEESIADLTRFLGQTITVTAD